MSIDRGSAVSYNANFPTLGINQGSQGFRDNFAIIKKAIERLQEADSTPESVFSITTVQDVDGALSYDVQFANNAFRLPTGDPVGRPEAGMIRYKDGTIQVHNGVLWGPVSGVGGGGGLGGAIGSEDLQAIIDAILANPSWLAAAGGLLPATSTRAGLLTAADKAKLDTMSVSFNEISFMSNLGVDVIKAAPAATSLKLRAAAPILFTRVGDEIVMSVDMTTGGHGNLPGGSLHALAVANGSAGFMSGVDKAKLDNLVTTVATKTKTGYMSAADKTKLDGLAASFSRINVPQGPIVAPVDGVLSIEGVNGISVSAVPGQSKLLVGIGSIAGLPIAQVTNTLVNFNSRNDRNGSPIDAPIVASNGTAYSSTANLNASVNIKFEWKWFGDEDSIDGFAIYVHQSILPGSYSFGTDSSDAFYSIPSSNRSFTLSSVTPERFYTIFVRAYRIVDPDIEPSRRIFSQAVKSNVPGENPYRPSAIPVFGGNVTGSIGGTAVPAILQQIADAKNMATWENITGFGRPQNFADVTADNIALNTLHVGSKTAEEIVGSIGNITSQITILHGLIDKLEIDPQTGANAAKAYAEAAQLARDLANQARSEAQIANDAAQGALSLIHDTQIGITQDRETAIAARNAALGALDDAMAQAAAAAQKAIAANNSASVARGYAEASQVSADAAGSKASAAQASSLVAVTSAAATRPYDFTQDATFWTGILAPAQGVTFQDVAGVGRTYQQKGALAGKAWIAPLKGFVTTAGRRIRAIVRARYVANGADVNGQVVRFVPQGQSMDGVYHEAGVPLLKGVSGYAQGGLLNASQGWQEFAVDFTPDASFLTQYPKFNIWFCWNDGAPAGTGRIEIVTYRLEDVTESSKAEINAAAAILESQAAHASQTAAEERAEAARQSQVSAATSAGAANTSRLDAAESATTALGAKTTAVQQAGVATNAALNAQNFSNAAAGSSFKATSEANRAESSATSAIQAAATASSRALEGKTYSDAAAGHSSEAETFASEAASSARAADLSKIAAESHARDAQTASSAASGFAQQAATFADDVSTKSSAALAAATEATSRRDEARTAAQAATERAAASATSASAAETRAAASEQSNVSARLVAASALPFDFAQEARFWARDVKGTPAERASTPPAGTFVTVTGIGKVFQSLNSYGKIAPLDAVKIEPKRIYRFEARVRATTNATTVCQTQLYVSGLSADYSRETTLVQIGGKTPLTVADGWVTWTGTVYSEQLSGSVYARPVVSYNEITGTQTIQILSIRVVDITEQKNAEAAAGAAVTSESNAASYRNAAGEFAVAAQDSATKANTSAGLAQTSATQASSSSQTAEGFSNQAALSQKAAAESAAVSGQKAQAASGFAQSAETSANESGIKAAAALASEVTASTTAAALFPSNFSQDGKFWAFKGGTPSYQEVLQIGRTVRIKGYTGPNWIAPIELLTVTPARRYRATVRARVFANGTYPDMQGCSFTIESLSPSTTIAFTKFPNTVGVASGVLKEADGWKVYSIDFAMVDPVARARVRFGFNEGPANSGTGTFEIGYFKVEDVTESAAAAGSASAAAVSASTAETKSNLASDYAASAQRSATNAETSHQGAINAAGLANTYSGQAKTYSEQTSRSESSARASMSEAAVMMGVAVEAANSAGTSAAAAATSAEGASSSVDEATAQAASATLAKNEANAAMAGSQSAAQAAADSASTAAAKATLAQESAAAAQTSSIAVQIATASSLPSTFDQDGLFFTSQRAGSPDTVPALTGPSATFTSVPALGRIVTRSGTPQYTRTRSVIASLPGRSYRITARVRQSVNPTDGRATTKLYFYGLNADYTDTAGSNVANVAVPGFQNSVDITTASGWVDLAVQVNVPVGGYNRPLLAPILETNSGETGGTTEILWLKAEDVTAYEAVQQQVLAAAQHASQAAVSQSGAEQSAQSAQTSKTDAQTALGQATIRATEAAQSAQNAEGHAATAVRASDLAAASYQNAHDAALGAKADAQAAVQSADLAQTRADDAGNYANAAQASASSAATKASEALGYSGTAVEARDTAEGAASQAVQQAGIATTAKNDAEQAASAALTSKGQAESFATAAGTYANTASQQAGFASTSASNAAQYQESALHARDDALGAAAQAQTQSGVAVSAAGATSVALSRTFPSDFGEDGRYFYVSGSVVYANVTEGRVLRAVDARNISTLAFVPSEPDRRYRMTVRVRRTGTNLPGTAVVLQPQWYTGTSTPAGDGATDFAGQTTSGYAASGPVTTASGFNTFVIEYTTPSTVTKPFHRVMVKLTPGSGGTLEVLSVKLEDMTAAGYAAAAYASKVAAEAAQSASESSSSISATQAGYATSAAGDATFAANQAASSAATAQGYANTASQESGLAVAAKDAAVNAKDAADVSAAAALKSRNEAAAASDQAGNYASTSTTQAGVATTKAGEASSYAQTALTARDDAAGSANTASQQAGIATTARNDAQTAAGQAAGSATAAAGSASTATSAATDAGNSATSATNSANTATTQAGNASTSAGNASTSATSAQSAVNLTIPDRPAVKLNFITASANSFPDAATPITAGTVVAIANEGDVLQPPAGTFNNIATRGWMPVSAARTFRVEARSRLTTDGNSGTAAVRCGLAAYSSSGAYLGLVSFTNDDSTWTVAEGWRTFTRDVTSAQIVAAFSTVAYVRGAFGTTTSGTSVFQLATLRFRDVTSEAAAAQSAAAASTSASNASASQTSAGQSATAAQDSAVAASTSASNAGTSANNASQSAGAAAASESKAATSESNASGSATSATQQAGLAATAKRDAETAAGLASNSASAAAGSASQASTSATNAGTSATSATQSSNTATTQATNAATSAASAQSAVNLTLPDRPAVKLNFVDASASVAPDSATPITIGTVATIANEGDVLQITGPLGNIATRGWMPVSSGRIFRAETRARITNDANSGASAVRSGFAAYNASGTYLGLVGFTADDSTWTVAEGWRTFTKQATSADVIAAFSTAAYVRAVFGSTTTGASAIQIALIRLRDVTSEVQAANSASAASTSASNALASETAAGQSASAAQSSAVTASTNATNAGTSASNASKSAGDAAASASSSATSESNAAGSATTASQQATLATTARNDAQTAAGQASNSATAAAGSASQASTSATDAGSAATSATQSSNTASTQATNATTQATNALNSATSAQNVANVLIPDRLSAKANFVAASANAAPESAVPITIGSIVNVANEGDVLQVSGTIGDIATRGWMQVSAGRTFRVEARSRITTDGHSGAGAIRSGFAAYSATGAYLGLVGFTADDTTWTVAEGWRTFTKNVTSAQLISAYASAAYVRAVVGTATTGSSTFQFALLRFRDVTSEVAADKSATAASTSASNAAASETAAGQSATASQNSAVTASTAATNAGTSETNANKAAGDAAVSASAAATSKSDAAGSATTASQQAGLAATSRNEAQTAAGLAQGSANAAATSASQAGSSATDAGTAATSATNASNAATSAFNATTAVATQMLPSDFLSDSRYWTGSPSGNPTLASNVTLGSFPTDATVGKVYEVTGSTALYPKGVLALIVGRRYKLTARVRMTTNPSSGSASLSASWIGLDSTYTVNGSPGTEAASGATLSTKSPIVVADGWVTLARELDATAATSVYARSKITITTGTGGIAQIAFVKIEDVTESFTSAGLSQAAATSASTANTKATEAGNSATAASNSQVAASSSYSGARETASSMQPFDFQQDGLFWSHDTTSYPVPDIANWSFATVSGIGRVAKITGNGDLAARGFVQLVANRRYRITARYRYTANNSAGQQVMLHAMAYNGSRVYLASTNMSQTTTVGQGWVNAELVTDANTLIAMGTNTGVYMRPVLRTQPVSGTTNTAAIEVSFLKIEDVTSELAAAGSATAAAGSASSASTSATTAGTSATAADTSRTLAETARGQAQTFANNASNSADNAAGSASSASTSSGASASSANLARAYGGATGMQPNSGFDAGLTGWTASYGTDTAAYSTSGTVTATYQGATNVLVTNTGARADIAGELRPISPDRTYRVTARVYVSQLPMLVRLGFHTRDTATTGQANIESDPALIVGWNTLTMEVGANTTKPIASTKTYGKLHLINNLNAVTGVCGVDFAYLEDITDAKAAAGFANAASTSASTAATKATDAGTSASAAQTAQTLAETAKGLAQTSATNAATSETNALGYSNAASSSSSVSAASATTAIQTVASTLPRDFAEAGKYWASSWVGDLSRATLLASPNSSYTFPVVSGTGKVVQIDATSASRDLAALGAVTYVAGRRWRLRVVMARSSASASVNLYLTGLSATYGDNAGHQNGSVTPTASFVEYVITHTGSATAGTVFLRPLVRVNSGIVQVLSVVLEDVTSELASASSATAAATSATNAGVSETNAGVSATVATTAKTEAQTAAGNASTFATNASNSATSAQGYATSASTSSGVAATNAGYAASSASGNWIAKGNFEDGVKAPWAGTGLSVVSVSGLSAAGLTKALLNSDRDVQDTTIRQGNFNGRVFRITGWVQNSSSVPAMAGIKATKLSDGGNAWYMVQARAANQSSWARFDVEVTVPVDTINVQAWMSNNGSLTNGDTLVSYWADLRWEDITLSKAAAASASAASTSAQTASTKATEAGTSADAASQAKTLAETARGQAQTFASNASGSADTAAGSASTATTQAGAASTSALNASGAQVAAEIAANRGGVTTFVDKGKYFFTAASSPLTFTNPIPDNSFRSVSGVGNVYFVANTTGSATVTAFPKSRKILPNTSGRTYRATIIVRAIDANVTALPQFQLWSDAGAQTNGAAGNAATLTPAMDWQTLTVEYVSTGGIPNISVQANLTVPVGASAELRFMNIEDVTSEKASLTYANAAATSAQTASTKATDAGTSADAASQAKTLAETARGQASTFANNASTSADNAAGSASNATVQAGAASSSALDARNTTANGPILPSTFDADGRYWAATPTGVATRPSYSDLLPSHISFATVTGIGRVMQVNLTIQTYVCPLGWVNWTSGQRYRIDVVYRATTGSTNVVLYPGYLTSALADAGGPNVQQASSTSWQTFSYVMAADAPAGTVYVRPALRMNVTASTTIQIASITIVDVTQSLSAQASANAASTSAQTASTKATDAGTAAIAAQTAQTAAETARGQASTFANNASTSADNAAGNASTASIQAGAASTSATNALNSSNAANNAARAIFPERINNTAQVFVVTDNGAGQTPPLIAQNAYVTDADFGTCVERTFTGTVAGVGFLDLIPVVAGRVYRLEVEAKLVSSTHTSVNLGLDARTLASDYTASSNASTLLNYPSPWSMTVGSIRKVVWYIGMDVDPVVPTIDTAAGRTRKALTPTSLIGARVYSRAEASGSGTSVVRWSRLKVTDVTDSQGAQISATAAATSAQTASTKATEAGTSADAASQSKTLAETARGQAQTFANNASSSADAAGTSSSNATSAATVAARSALQGQNYAQKNLIGQPYLTTTDTGAWVSAGYVAGDAPTGLVRAYVLRNSGNDLPYGDAVPGNFNGRTFRATGYFKAPQASMSIAIGFIGLNPSGSAVNIRASLDDVAVVGTWVKFDKTFTVPANTFASARPFVRSNTPFGVLWTDLVIEDITESTSSAGSANAAATSAQTASTKATEAGSSAQAASDAKTLAETARGQAQTSASNAASSESNALGSANAASSSAGVSANNASTASTAAATALQTAASLFPERVNATGDGWFRATGTNTGSGDPATKIMDSAGKSQIIAEGSNGLVFQYAVGTGTQAIATVGAAPATPGKVYQIDAEWNVASYAGTAFSLSTLVLGMDATYTSTGNPVKSASVNATGVYKVSWRVSDVANATYNVSAWPTGSIWLRFLLGQISTGGLQGSTVYFRRATVRDVTAVVAAEQQASAASGFASAASTSAQTANTRATDAGTAATAAQTAQTAAETAQGRAATSATNAATSETNALGSANSASTSAGVSATSATSAAQAAQSSGVRNFEEKGRYWTTDSNVKTGASMADSFFRLASGVGTVLFYINGGGSSTTIYPRPKFFLPNVMGRSYRATARVRSLNADCSFVPYFLTASDSGLTGNLTSQSFTVPASSGWQTVTFEYTNSPATSPFISMQLAMVIPSGGTAEVSSMWIEDITSEKAAAGSATAAATAATTATTKATDAGTSATAAQTAQTAAETARGQAQTSATNAATSEQNALTSANSASSSAGVSSTSAATATRTTAQLMPSTFDENDKYWFSAHTSAYLTDPIIAAFTFPTVTGVGKVAQYTAPANAANPYTGELRPRGIRTIETGRVYRATALVRVSTASTNGEAARPYIEFRRFDDAGATLSEVAGEGTTSSSWTLLTLERTSEQLLVGGATKFYPYMRCAGSVSNSGTLTHNGVVQVAYLKFEDVTSERAATTVATQTMPSDFSNDGLFFSNDGTGQFPSNPWSGTFKTI